MLQDLLTMNEFRRVLGQIKNEGGNTRDALHGKSFDVFVKSLHTSLLSLNNLLAMFHPDYRGMHPRFALEKAIKGLNEFLLRFRNRRSHRGDDDFLESGECPDPDGVALRNADNSALLQEILRKDVTLEACHKKIAAHDKEIATLRQQAEQAQKERAVEKEQLAEANRRTKAALKQMKVFSDEKDKLKVENDNLQAKVTILNDRLSKQSNGTDMDARLVVGLILFSLILFPCTI